MGGGGWREKLGGWGVGSFSKRTEEINGSLTSSVSLVQSTVVVSFVFSMRKVSSERYISAISHKTSLLRNKNTV